MKRPLFAVLLCALLPALLHAQADTAAAPEDDAGVPGTWRVVASGGWTFPAEPSGFADHFKTNYNFGGGIAYALPPGGAGYGEVSLLVHYYNVLFTRSGFRAANNLPANASVYGYPGDVLTAMLQFRGVLSDGGAPVAPYFTAGFGFFHIALPALGVTGAPAPLVPEYTKNTIGWSVGLGADVRVNEMLTLFGEGRFLLGVTETNGHKLVGAGGGVRVKI